MQKPLVLIIVAVALGGVGWWGYKAHRSSSATTLELGAPKNAAAPGTNAGARTGANPGSGPAAAAGGKDAPKGPAKGGALGPGGPVGVEAARAETVALTEELTAVGTLRANESVVVKPEIAGRIEVINFTDGARVQKGALLIRLDAALTEAEVQQARAELALSEANHQRTADLAKRNFVSGSALDQALATLKIQQAKLQLAQARLQKSEIRAPFSGVLGLRNISVGDYVKDGSELVTLEDVSGMKVDLRLPERFIGQLGKGQAIQLTVDAYPNRTFSALLEALDAQVDANGRALLARGRLPNPDGSLRTGMFAKARVVLKEKPQAVVIPEEAIIPIGGDTFVYRIDAGKAKRVRVTTGLRRDAKVEVISGLVAGDTVVTAGQVKLQRDGQDVVLLEPSNRTPPRGEALPGEAAAPEAQRPAKAGG